MAKSTATQSDPEPDLEVKRRILTQKVATFRAQAYENTVNAEVAEVIGQDRKEFEQRAKKLYSAARKAQEMLDELPEPEEEEPEEKD